MPRRRLLHASIAAASAFGTLALVESGLRLAGVRRETREFHFERAAHSLLEDAGRYVPHPRRFFALAPNYRGVAGHPSRDSLGAWPFRGRPIEPAPAGLYRIGLFGDSCIYGAGLDAADMLGERLARALARRGHAPTRVQIASFGVPGYSTVQIHELLDEALASHRLDLAVFYAAAWNDQGPALGANDLELRARVERGSSFYEDTAIFAFLRGLSRRREIDAQAILRAWAQGTPFFGTRVPEQEVRSELRAMVSRARAVGCDVRFLVPAHPPRSRREHPRLLEDAESVRRVAIAERVPYVDTPEMFAANPGGEERLFSDFVHPSPDGFELLAEALAERLAPRLERHFASHPFAPELDWGALAVEPRSTSCFGGERLALRFERASFSKDAVPAVVVGGAPLLELAVDPDGRTLRGTLIANRAGLHDVLVQTARGCALFRDALELVSPTLEIERGARWRLRFHSQPNDLALVRCADRLREAPAWSGRGADWLDPAHGLGAITPLRAGADGMAELELAPPVQAPGDALFLQAEVHRYAADGRVIEARWTPVLEVRRSPH